jgi:Mn2+/Fe2+ NRAMP family transporter
VRSVQPSGSDDDGLKRSDVLQILWIRLKEHPLSRVGPGLITGVADDDPSGIATSQAGAQFGLNMLWTMPLAFPLMAAFWPNFTPNSDAATVVVGVFGTTISPYLFFWQASEEVEDMQSQQGAVPLVRDKREAGTELRRISWDTWSGMFYSDITAYFIILATAVTLNVAGMKDIETAAQAASALRPLAGDFAFLLFAVGILGVGLIGVPVLAGSAAYALSEAMGWKWGLERKATEAHGFYGVIAVSVLAGLVIQYSSMSPMKALFWSAVINGVVAVPLMVVIILVVSKKSVMGAFTASRSIVIIGWIATAVMGAAAVRMFIPG